MRLFLNSVPLSDRMYLGHMCTGKYWSIRVATMVSAVLSGIGKSFWPSCQVVNNGQYMFVA